MRGIDFQRLFNWRAMSPQRAVTLVFTASVLLVVVSYGVWQFGRLLSPVNEISTSNPILKLSASDRDLSAEPLPNSLTDTTPPYFTYNIQDGPTILEFGNDGKLDLARYEIRVDYR
ncbi:MAG: hypothetical protein WEC83_01950 [Patescibacteria group bacterium]